MAYAVHITRCGPQVEGESRPITLEEWLAPVAADPEMRLKGNASINSRKGEIIRWNASGLAEWTDPDSGNKAYFDHAKPGEVLVGNPSQATLVKIFRVARSLGATVRGDGGEHYDASGRPTNETV